MDTSNVNVVLGQDQCSTGPLMIHFRRSARYTDRPNPDPTLDSVDLQQNVDMGAEAEQAREQEEEQDVQWTAEFDATGSTTGDTVTNIYMSRATIDDVAGRRGVKAAASQSSSHVAPNRTMGETLTTQASSKLPPPTPTPPIGPAMAALHTARRLSQGKPLEMIKRRRTPPSSSSPRRRSWTSKRANLKQNEGNGASEVLKKCELERIMKPPVKQSTTAWSTTPQFSPTPTKMVAVTVSRESAVSEVAKNSRRTVGVHQVGDTRIYIDEMRRACVAAMTALLGDGFQVARCVYY